MKLFVVVAFVFAAGCGSAPKAPPSREGTAGDASPAPRILQFYAAPNVAAPGQPATLCYGVENATAVKLDPPVEAIKPSFNRCFPVSPDKTTRYTLTAERDGVTVSRTVEVAFSTAPAPPAATQAAGSKGPEVLSFTASPTEVAAGQAVMLCFQADGDRLELQPGSVSLGEAKVGCYSVAPKQTTEYTLIAHRDSHSARRSVAVTVK